MEKISKLILCVIPNERCNLKCKYCYISQVDGWSKPARIGHSPEFIAKCLSRERLGGVALVNLTAKGETLLVDNIVEIIRCFLNEGHYVEIVTNGTVQENIKEILDFEDTALKRVFFKISFHYSELKRLNKLDLFFDNVNMIRKSQASFTLELMANDELENDIDELVAMCRQKVGAVCHATIGRDDAKKDKPLLSLHSKDEFEKRWEKLDSDMLRYKIKMLGKKRKEFCYAGKWSLYIDLISGEAKQCYWQPVIQNIYENPNRPIKFFPVGHYCTLPYCINAHAHITWGIIPRLEAPTYYSMRNRLCFDGNNWIKDEFAYFSKSKLYDSNEELPGIQRIIYTIFVQPMIYMKYILQNPGRIMAHIRKMM
jgi:molybdenum cofactor biosynthesis enzyme MoaA